jgi:L-threonylcarbamoyladenylate synthase
MGHAMKNFQFLSKCSLEAINSSAHSLLAGHLVGFPTETVYGLGADACNATAVARIYSVKGRPTDHPLIVHVASMDALDDWADDVPEYAILLARSFWPGPLTLVLRRSELVGDFLTGGQDTVGIRVPDHPVALGLLEAFVRIGGLGLAAPSANRFGGVSPTTAQAVADELSDYLGDADQILDGGACKIGVESTIIDCTRDLPRILRPGALTIEMIVDATGLDVVMADASLGKAVDFPDIRISGSLNSHYAPAATVLLDRSPLPDQGFIAMADVVTPEGVVRLAAPESHEDFARVLYSALRAADDKKLQYVTVMQPQGDGIAIAIRDRLQRASNSD